MTPGGGGRWVGSEVGYSDIFIYTWVCTFFGGFKIFNIFFIFYFFFFFGGGGGQKNEYFRGGGGYEDFVLRKFRRRSVMYPAISKCNDKRYSCCTNTYVVNPLSNLALTEDNFV